MFHSSPARPTIRLCSATAVVVTAVLAVAGCSGSPTPGVPDTAGVVSTVGTPTTITALSTVTATATVHVTATEQRTETQTSTLTPKPAGTTTVVHTSTKVRTAVSTVTAPPPKPKVAFGDGTYVVGKDVAPGIYQASDPNPPDGLCYWETDNRSGDIIDNGVNNGIVHVGSSVFSLRVRDCGDWTKIG